MDLVDDKGRPVAGRSIQLHDDGLLARRGIFRRRGWNLGIGGRFGYECLAE
jgi:hypothetical protein